MKINSFKIFLMTCILIGIGIRIACIPGYYPEHGAVLQAAMGRALFNQGALLMEFGPIFEDEHDLIHPSLSQHFPPVYPVLIGTFTAKSKNVLDDLRILSFRITLLTFLIILLLTRRMFGEIQSYFVTAGFLLHGALIDNASKCLSENIQILLIVLFLASVMMSKIKRGYWILSGFLLGLAYLSKSTLPFWFTIGIVSFTVMYVSFKNGKIAPWLISALAVFILTILPWGLRNYYIFGTFETSEYISSSLYAIFSEPLLFRKGIFINLPVICLMITPFLIFAKELRKVDIKDPFDFLCIFFAVGSFALSILYSACFYSIEYSYLPVNSIRYVLIAIVPILMLIAKHSDFSSRLVIRKAFALISVLLISAVFVLIYAYTVTDKPLINEPDWVLSQKVAHSLSRLSAQDKKRSNTIDVVFDDSINKNDFYYYLFALESAGIKYINLVHAENYRPNNPRRASPTDGPAIIIYSGEYAPHFQTDHGYSKYTRCTLMYGNSDPDLFERGLWIYRNISKVDKSGHKIDNAKHSVRSLAVQKDFWLDLFIPPKSKKDRSTQHVVN